MKDYDEDLAELIWALIFVLALLAFVVFAIYKAGFLYEGQ